MCLSVSSASCRVARGMIPGSLKAVRRSVAMTNINNKQVTTGMAAVKRGINRRQLKQMQQISIKLERILLLTHHI